MTQVGHTHGVEQQDRTFWHQPILRCPSCNWAYQVAGFSSRSGVAEIHEPYPSSPQRRFEIRTVEGMSWTYEHFCAPISAPYNLDHYMMRIEAHLLDIKNCLDAKKSHEIARLEQTIDLLQARLKWAEEEKNGDVPEV